VQRRGHAEPRGARRASVHGARRALPAGFHVRSERRHGRVTRPLRWSGVGLTDRGLVRRSNQDAYFISNEHGLWVVADGMGGHAAGDVASRLAVERLATLLHERDTGHDAAEWLRDALLDVNRTVHEAGRQTLEYAGMGTTIVAVLKDADPTHVVVGYIGDSRAYRYGGETLMALTRDHTLAEDAVRAGLLSAEQARHHPHSHILSRAVGPD